MNIDITGALFTLRIQYEYTRSLSLKLNVKRAPVLQMFIEILLLKHRSDNIKKYFRTQNRRTWQTSGLPPSSRLQWRFDRTRRSIIHAA